MVKGIYKKPGKFFSLLKKMAILLLTGFWLIQSMGVGAPLSHSHEHSSDAHHAHADSFHLGEVASHAAHHFSHQSAHGEWTQFPSSDHKQRSSHDKDHSHQCHHTSSPFYLLGQGTPYFIQSEQGVVQSLCPANSAHDGFLRHLFKPPRVV